MKASDAAEVLAGWGAASDVPAAVTGEGGVEVDAGHGVVVVVVEGLVVLVVLVVVVDGSVLVVETDVDVLVALATRRDGG